MCDTWVALKDTTAEGNVIFAKNSDRPISDCQPLQFQPRNRWSAGSKIQTSYIQLPQVEITFAHLGSKPYWCWGYEEGINEWGVVIGNEALFTKPYREAVTEYRRSKQGDPGLLGMDLIRLALERCRTARQAVALIAEFVETYGQFGSASPGKPHDSGSYDNAFIIADPNEAYTVETAGRRWAARHSPHGCTSISNEPTIRSAWDLGSPDLEAHARQKGWWSGTPKGNSSPLFDFAHAYIDEKTTRQASHMRVMRSRQLLEERSGEINLPWMKRIARDHYEDTFFGGPTFDAANPDFLSLCMHVSPADFTWGNTASSCVAVLPKESSGLPIFWWTPGPPCNGCYVPFFPNGSRLPEIVSKAGQVGSQTTPADQAKEDIFSPDSYWWLFRRLNDLVKGDAIKSLPGYYPTRNTQVRARFDALEQAFAGQAPTVVNRALEKSQQNPAEMAKILDEFSETCLNQVLAVLQELLEQFSP